MDIKKLAIGISIFVLLPTFLILFIDAVYAEPKYDTYCNTTFYPEKAVPYNANCTFEYGAEYNQCVRSGGDPQYDYNATGCQVYAGCDYCRKDFETARQEYNRNVFFILAPIGLFILILGLYLTVEYIGAGLMFAGLFTLFYATIRYFTDLSKLLRALVVLIELLVIIWIGYKKIEARSKEKTSNAASRKRNR